MGFVRIEKLWKDGVVPYEFDETSAANGSFVAAVQAAMLEWMNKTEMIFVPWRAGDKDYVRFKYDPGASICTAGGVGNKGGVTTLVCTDFQPTLIHELGHTVGFIHEHQRPDRDNFVDVNPDAAKADPYNILPAIPFLDQPIGAYDCNSVNHYGADKFISPLPGGCATIGSTTGPSFNDMVAVRQCYSFQPSAGHIHQASAISRGANNLELFARWADNGLNTAKWNGSWREWERLVDGQGLGVSPISAVSRTPNSVDIFVRGTNNGIYTAGWDPIFDQKVARRSGISAVSRTPNNIDLFVVGENGQSWTAAWDHGNWKGWWPVKPD